MHCHYIPQFYLRGFIEETPPEGHAPYVWVYDIEKANWKNKAPENILFEIDLYAFTEVSGSKSYEIENAFTKLESEMASILREAIIKRKCLSDYERAVVSEFVAVMMTRTKKFINNIEKFTADIATMFLQMYAARPQEYGFLKERYKKETGKEFPDINKDVLANIEIHTSHDFLLGMMGTPINEIKKDIYLMNWTFVFSQENLFITSDSPVVLFNPNQVTRFDGAGIDNSEIYFPLSKNICMIISWDYRLRSFLDVPASLVERINKRIIQSADNCIVAPIKNFLGSTCLTETHKVR